jgi:choline-glycine betaine transporter
MMTTGGKARPSTINRIFWGVVLGLTAAILMILGGTGSANTLQQAAIITGTPFAFVCFLALLSLMKDFGSSYGRVLLQDETVLVGSSRKSDPDTPGAGDPVESDDD